MKNQINFEAIIQERFDELKSVSPRNPQAAARARARFLAQARAASEAQRNQGWGFLFRKQQFAMNLFVTLLVVVSLFLGGATTVSAAQDELPGQPLYAVKTFSEDISLQFESNPEAKVERLMELTQIRVDEMKQLINAGQTPPEQVQLRLEQHLKQTLQLCSNMDDATLDQTLSQLRDQLQQQDQDMKFLQSHAGQGAQSALEQTRSMLQTQLHMVDNGLLNHEMFRTAVHNGFHYGQTQTPPAAGPVTTNQEQNGPATPQLVGPGNGNGNGVGPNPDPGKPNESATLTPKNNGSNPGNNGGGNNPTKEPKNKDSDKTGSGGTNPNKPTPKPKK